ncbi:hypothetical protein [Streptomyces sp. NPDC000878]
METTANTLTLEVTRALPPDQQVPGTDTTEAQGHVTAVWHLPDGGEGRAPFVLLVSDTVR